MFFPLHLKSEYSLGLGTDPIADLVAGAAQRGYSALALTDLENLYGQLRLHHECRSRGIKPLTGLELRPGFDGRREFGSRAGRIVLLAADRSGYGSLCRLVSLRRAASAVEGGDPAPGADPVPQVLRHAAGLFALSDDPRVVERLVGAGFPCERTGVLLPRPDAAAADLARREAADRLGVRLVADLDAVFLDPSGHALHLLQVAVRQGRLLRKVQGLPGTESGERWLRPAREAAALFADQPQALAAAAEIAEACDFSFETLAPGPPAAGFGAVSPQERLRELCRWSVSARFPKGRGWTLEHGKRLQAELALFEQLNFTDFMLVVAQILEHCRTQGIPTVVRGSAVSSLVLHLLGGSPVDPLREGLLFERFLHPGKSSWPDVDIDLPWQRRDEVIDWVFRQFGRDRVAMVAAHHTFQLRSALREGLKACAVAPAAIESLIRALPPEELAGAAAGAHDDAALTGSEEVDFLSLPGAAATGQAGSGRLESVARRMGLQAAVALVRRLVGRPRHVAVHPGGIVVAGESLERLLPLELSQKGVLITQYDLVAVARLGLVKIDLLGNRCLSELAEVLREAGYPDPGRLDAIPAEDPATLALIDRADTLGCFQLESPAMRSLLARLPIRRQSDLTAALALIRPGAAAGDVKAEFVRLARGEVPELQPFPILAKRLRETHGLFLYEEDIMLLLSLTGGLTLGEADELRREIVHSGGDPVLLAGLRSRFLEGALRAGAAKRPLAHRAWALAARFAAYSFNKAHAASYARLAYYSAFAKTHHPVQFAAALLNHHQGMYPLRTEAAALQRLGVELRPPQVNRSELACACHFPAVGSPFVQVGLDRIKVLSQRAVRMILASREAQGPYLSLRDLLDRVRLTARELEALVLSGACDELAPLAPADYPFAHEAALELVQRGGAPARLDTLPVPRPLEQDSQQVFRYRGLVRVKNELRFLEMHLSAHPAALLRGDALRQGCRTVAEALGAADGESLRLMVLIAALRRVPTVQGPLEFISLEDESGILEAVLLPTQYRRFNASVTTPGPFLVEGKLRREHEAVHLEMLELAPFHERPRR